MTKLIYYLLPRCTSVLHELHLRFQELVFHELPDEHICKTSVQHIKDVDALTVRYTIQVVVIVW